MVWGRATDSFTQRGHVGPMTGTIPRHRSGPAALQRATGGIRMHLEGMKARSTLWRAARPHDHAVVDANGPRERYGGGLSWHGVIPVVGPTRQRRADKSIARAYPLYVYISANLLKICG